MDLKQSKTILAKLLAAENVTVIHQKANTASFNPTTRVLTLPIWKDMDGVLYDLLTGHEVGHALFTPAEGWHDVIEKHARSRAFAGFLNIVEDARIEKLVRRKFPGLRASFYAAYQQLLDRDFFGVRNKTIADMLLIDRLNLHFKVGSQLRVPFQPEEQTWIDRMAALETWAEVEKLAEDLFEYCKQELEEQKNGQEKRGLGEIADGEDDGEGEPIDAEELTDFDELDRRVAKYVDRQEEPVAETDEAQRNAEKSLLDSACLPYHNMIFGKYDSRERIVPVQQVMQEMMFNETQELHRGAFMREFKEKNSRYISFLVQQFEMKRSADQLSRAKISKSGEIDVKQVHRYKISEDLFKRFTVLPNGKNHGLIMIIDMSGSMTNNMGPTIEQTLVLVEFCRKVNIGFEVYGFTNNALPYETMLKHQRQAEDFPAGYMSSGDAYFMMRQYFSDSMTPSQYKQQVSNMVMMLNLWNNRAAGRDRRFNETDMLRIPDSEHLNGTPLNDALMMLPDVFARFKARTKADIVNMVVLSDGESDNKLCGIEVYGNGKHIRQMRDPNHCNVVITDSVTKKSVKVQPTDSRGTRALVKFVGEITGANMIGFHITPETNKSAIRQALFGRNYDYATIETEVAKRHSEFRRTGLVVSTDQGYTEHYLIRGGKSMMVDDGELDVEDNATTREIERAFQKMQGNKQTSRVILSRFVAQIA